MNKVKLRIILQTSSLMVIAATAIFSFQNCSNMQAVSLSEEGSTQPPAELARQRALYTRNCSSCHGPVDSSAKLNRNYDQIQLALTEVSRMRNIILSRPEIEDIARALQTDQGSTPVENGDHLEFACTPGQMQKTPLVKLTNREFRNSLNSLLDGFSTALKSDATLVNTLASIPTDIATQNRNKLKEQSLLNSSLITTSFFSASFRASELVAGNATGLRNYPNTNQCLDAATITQSCHQLFVRELGSRAFRRQLTVTEGNALAARLWDTGLSKSELIQLTFTGLTAMPDFLYKIYDRGNPIASGSTILRLTAHELASKLALFLTGAPADATLRALADNEQILTDSVLSQQVDRLLALPSARDTIRRLFRESYGYDVYDRLQYDSNFINGINTSGLDQVMNTELDNYFSEVVLNRAGTFEDVMTSNYTNFTDSRLAYIYGVNATNTLPSERSGFLNRAAMLTKRSGYSASPIKRGLAVLEHVLCEDIGLPPPSAPTSLPSVEGQILSTREKTFRTTEVTGSSCIQCHGRMNNLGYAFESFNSFGVRRNVETIYNGNNQVVAQLPINSNASTMEITGRSVSLRDSLDLVRELGRSDRAMMCFVKHLKEFESRIATDSTANCQMNQSLRTLYGGTNNQQGSIADAIKSLVLSPEFKRWNN